MPLVSPAADSTGAVIFDYQSWALRFPELAVAVTEPIAADLFDEAGNYFNNTGNSPAPDLMRRQRILFMVTAHLAQLFVGPKGKGPTGVVGRVSSASEGSVSVSSEMANAPKSAAWWYQTQYGATAYTMMKKYALTRYVPGPRPTFDRGPRHLVVLPGNIVIR